MKLIRTGVTREVILIGNYAVKIPSFKGYRNFLQGILANEQEAFWYRNFKWTKKLCPVLWKSWGYFVIVMMRAEVLTEIEARSKAIRDIDDFLTIEIGEEGKFPCEKKTDSFGWIWEDNHIDDNPRKRLVILDYGS